MYDCRSLAFVAPGHDATAQRAHALVRDCRTGLGQPPHNHLNLSERVRLSLRHRSSALE